MNNSQCHRLSAVCGVDGHGLMNLKGLLVTDDVVLLVSSDDDLRCVLESTRGGSQLLQDSGHGLSRLGD